MHPIQAGGYGSYYRPYDELMPWGSHLTEVEEITASLERQGVKTALLDANLAEPFYI